jgi:hypothetical protein
MAIRYCNTCRNNNYWTFFALDITWLCASAGRAVCSLEGIHLENERLDSSRSALQAAEAHPRPPHASAHAHLPKALQIRLHKTHVLFAGQEGVVWQRVEGGVVDDKEAAISICLEFILLALRSGRLRQGG